MKRKLYIVFDRFHSTEAGGLISAYVSFVDLLKDDYDIEIISVIDARNENHASLNQIKVHYLTKKDFFPRLKVLVQAAKQFKIHIVLKEIFNLIKYLAFIPFAKKKIRKIVSDEDIVVSSSPAASMYIPKDIKFIQEIHTKFEYFWGNHKLGTLQSKLMSKPYITVFRTKADMEKANQYFNSTYSYNFINNELFNDTVSIGEEKRKHKIIYMGRFVKEKNLPKMIECAKQLKKQIPDFSISNGRGRYNTNFVNSGENSPLITRLIFHRVEIFRWKAGPEAEKTALPHREDRFLVFLFCPMAGQGQTGVASSVSRGWRRCGRPVRWTEDTGTWAGRSQSRR